MWYTDQRNGYIGPLDPVTGKIVDYPTPAPGSGPLGLRVAPEGRGCLVKRCELRLAA